MCCVILVPKNKYQKSELDPSKKQPLSKLWSEHYFYLFNLFGTKQSFYTWHGRHKEEMKDDMNIEEIIKLRKELLSRKALNK